MIVSKMKSHPKAGDSSDPFLSMSYSKLDSSIIAYQKGAVCVSNEDYVLKYQQCQDEDEKRQILTALYLQNDGLIASVAMKYRGYEDIDDLKQEGFIGLMTAADRWSPEGGASFAGFALEWIRQSIRRSLDERGLNIRVAAYRKDQVLQLRKYRTEYERDHGRQPSKGEVMKALELTPKKLKQIEKADVIMGVLSLSEQITGEDQDITLGDTIADPRDVIGEVEDDLQQDQLKAELWSMVDDLDQRQAAVIRKRFIENKTLKDCGSDFGISLDRVRQLEASALRKLRSPSRAKRLKSFYEDGERYSRGLKGSGINRFRQNGESSTERVALYFIKHERQMR